MLWVQQCLSSYCAPSHTQFIILLLMSCCSINNRYLFLIICYPCGRLREATVSYSGRVTGTICRRQPKKRYMFERRWRDEKVSGDRPTNPNGWKHLRAILLHCFNLQINSREFSKAAKKWKEKEKGGKETLTFNLPFSCYVHLHSHDARPPEAGGITAKRNHSWSRLFEQNLPACGQTVI